MTRSQYKYVRIGIIFVVACLCVRGIIYTKSQIDLESVAEDRDRAVSRYLVGTLKSPDARVREKAAWELRQIGKPAIEPLIAALKDSDVEVRRNAVATLSAITKLGPITTSSEATEAIEALLQDPDVEVRRSATSALGVKHSSVIGPLIAALRDPDAGVRSGAAFSLGEIKDSSAVEPLITALKDRDDGVRRSAAMALGETKGSRAVSALSAAWNARDNVVITGAVRFFIQRLDKPGSEDVLIDALNSSGDTVAATALLTSGNVRLHKAAVDWADRHGYGVTTIPVPPP